MVFVALFIGLADSVAGWLRDSIGGAPHPTITLSDLTTAAVKNIEMLRLWQFSSLLLAVIFIPWSYFYWDNIVAVNDRRYLPAALGIHLIWLFCWYQATRPLLLSLQNWRELKLSALSASGADHAAIKDISPENKHVTHLFSVNTDSAPLSVTRKLHTPKASGNLLVPG